MRRRLLALSLTIAFLAAPAAWGAAKAAPEKKAAPAAKAQPESKPAPQGESAAPPADSKPGAEAKPPEPPKSPAEALRADLDRIFAEAGLAKTSVAVRIIAAGEPAEVLYALRPDQPMVPASTMKLVITAACFDRLGPDWRIRTTVGHIPSAGTDAKYDLAVIGGGDPNFSGRFWNGDIVGAFRRWADVLKARGLTALGRIVLDDSLFDDTTQHPRWPGDQRAKWYEAPVSALVLNDSCVNIRVSPGKAGEAAVVRVEPPGSGVDVDGTIVTVADKAQHSFSIERVAAAGPGAAVRLRVAGRYWAGAAGTTEFRTVVNPAMFFGSALAEALRSEGIAVAGPVVREKLTDVEGRARPEFETDVIHTSRLDATAAVANKRSQGLYAECLCKLLGAYAGAPNVETPLPMRQGSWAAGTAEARRWMAESGIPADGCVIDDGSGLSKENRLTPLAVTEVLRQMLQRHGERFVQTLAAPGQDGTLSKRMRGTAAEGRVFAKTGYIFGASGLSGYVRAKSGRTIIFSVLVNDMPWGELWKAHAAEDKACLRLVDY
jgi:D-alanyl-D-alanine carboxypeptidase/D-alanyl-D-alanine-endopeptidase (penicillin-binding protein 4)